MTATRPMDAPRSTHIPGPLTADSVDTVRLGLGVAGLTVVALLVVALPLTWIAVIALSVVSSITLGVLVAYLDQPAAYAIRSEAISSPELRERYSSLLTVLADLDRTIAAAPRLPHRAASMAPRYRAAVALCGRMAQLASPRQRATPDQIAAQQARVHACLETTRAALESLTAQIARSRTAAE